MTTTTSPSAASDAPWYHGVAPLPVRNAPPWIHTSTGRRAVVTRRREHVQVVALLGGGKAAAAQQPFHAAERLRTQGTVRRGVEHRCRVSVAERGDGDRLLEPLGGRVRDPLEDRDVDGCGTMMADGLREAADAAKRGGRERCGHRLTVATARRRAPVQGRSRRGPVASRPVLNASRSTRYGVEPGARSREAGGGRARAPGVGDGWASGRRSVRPPAVGGASARSATAA